MSSLDLVNEQIAKFLESAKPEVLCIRGHWGIGKTYAWNEGYKKNFEKIALSHYAYVSLFGINTLDDLKLAIFQNKDSIRDTRQSSHWFKKNIGKNHQSIQEVMKAVPKLIGVPGSVALKFLIEKLPEQTIICIDDLERRGKNLELKDVMGLITQLKEEKNCKVVLILNDEQLTTSKDDFQKLKEKVIDKDIQFKTSIEDVEKIAFKDYQPEGYYKTTITKACHDLGIKNIRIINKIKDLLNQLSIDIFERENFHESTKYSVLRTLALATYAAYGPTWAPLLTPPPPSESIDSVDPELSESGIIEMPTSDKIPDTDFIKEYSSVKYYVGKEKQNDPTDPRHKFLEKYSYGNTDELDREIIDSVERGYFNTDVLWEHIRKHNQSVIDKIAKEDFHKAWDVFHDSFDDNKNEVVASLYNACEKSIGNVSLGNIDGVICTLRELGDDEKADALIDTYLAHSSDPARFDTSPSHLWEPIRDKKFHPRLNERYQELIPKKSLRDALETIAGKSWNPEDHAALSKATADDYYKLFKKIKDRHLTAWIRAGLSFPDQSLEGQPTVPDKIRTALVRISKESPLNKLRMKKFGIQEEIDKPLP
ncbi:MAG: hypothetical protein ACK5O1_06190 [Holosporales bacterium]